MAAGGMGDRSQPPHRPPNPPSSELRAKGICERLCLELGPLCGSELLRLCPPGPLALLALLLGEGPPGSRKCCLFYVPFVHSSMYELFAQRAFLF